MSYIPINYFHANAHFPADFPTAAMRSAIQLFIFRSCAIPYTRGKLVALLILAIAIIDSLSG